MDTINDTLKNLLSELTNPRFGPVLMDLPVNIQMSNMPTDTPKPPYHFLWPTKTNTKYDLTPFINESKRPLIIFGHGVKLAGVVSEAMNLHICGVMQFLCELSCASTTGPLGQGQQGDPPKGR